MQSGTQPQPPGPTERIAERLALFAGGTGGLDSWLTSDNRQLILQRLSHLGQEGLSCAQFNQLLALAHQAEISEGCFSYYWLSVPKQHTYDVTKLPDFDESYVHTGQILTLDQLYWGLYRCFVDFLLYFGDVRNGYGELRKLSFGELTDFFLAKRYDTMRMIHRGPSIPLADISQDDRYLIAEQACKSFEPADESEADLLNVLRGAWIDHSSRGGGTITTRELLSGAFVQNGYQHRQREFEFSADEILDQTVTSEEDLLTKYSGLASTFHDSRKRALENTQLYLSMANDLDVYVATSMRARSHFREMARTCQAIFTHPAIKHFNLRYFDPTLSAAAGHEDKGLLECLMVKCAKVLIYTAGDRDSYGKDAEAAMALSLGKPVIFLCDEESRRSLFRDIHPLSRLIDFSSGIAVGGMATTNLEDACLLLNRLFENDMRYSLERTSKGHLRLVEKLTRSVVRVQTSHPMLRETFWNCYHRLQ